MKRSRCLFGKQCMGTHRLVLIYASVVFLSLLACADNQVQETLPPLKDGQSPQTIDEVWAGFDPTAEALDVEIHKAWEEDGTVFRAVRYRIGTFKGKPSWMSALYGFPKGGSQLPGLVQVHGGGGRAKKGECITHAKRGYATISLNWRGDQRYLSDENLPAEAQTDWGAVDGGQTSDSRGIEPKNDKKYDSVPSGRNGGSFLRTLAARRALTFLEQQPEVDGSKLGILGHSMGAVITMQTAAMDSRVKAAAPSCGPPINRDDDLVARTGNAAAYATKLNCPTLFMSPSNDFFGHVEDMEWIMDRMPAKVFNMARSEHFNHKHNASCAAANFLWFDAHLKKCFTYPDMPALTVDLETKDGRPLVIITPDQSKPIAWIDIYYTQDAQYNDYPQIKSRFWKYAHPVKQGGQVVAALDLYGMEQPLWIFANVHYKLEKSRDDYKFKNHSDEFTVTSRMIMKSNDELRAAGTKATGSVSTIVESFDKQWEKNWYFPRGGRLPMESWCLNDQSVAIPEYGKLVIKVKSQEQNRLRVGINDYKAGDYSAEFTLKGGDAVETIEVYPFMLNKKEGGCMSDWQDVPRSRIALGAAGRWQGIQPEFKQIS